MTSRQQATVAITATFTAEPVAASLVFWLRRLGQTASVEFAPYNQVLQQLLDPASLLGRNLAGMNILLVRWEDSPRLANEPVTVGQVSSLVNQQCVERIICELVRAAKEFVSRSPVPCLLVICPNSPPVEADPAAAGFFRRIEQKLAAEMAAVSGVHLVTPADLFAAYPVADYYDAAADRQGHIPFTAPFFTALGTLLARRLFILQQPPSKVIVLDCDNTLWRGVVGEDGVDGIRIDAASRALQEFMLAQRRAGVLLCLCSKNNEADVAEVFEQRADMVLRRDHFIATKINWQPKSENLREFARELSLGLDSFIFIDDNPAECSEVQAGCPEVLTLQLPHEPACIAPFLQHFWAFDKLNLTDEDRQRAVLYQQSLQREQFQKASHNFANFIAELNLEIGTSEMTPEQLPRVAQLTERTNQFNATTIRRNESEIRTLCAGGGHQSLAVTVKDRFGDYGLVGVMMFSAAGDTLRVDTFLLSCRALGKGVEHRMLARLGEIARSRGLKHVELPFRSTQKNQPAREFLENVGALFRRADHESLLYVFPADFAAKLQFALPERSAERPPSRSATETTSQASSAGNTAAKSELLNWIANEMRDVAAIHKAVLAGNRRARPELPTAFVSPRNPLEELLASIFAKVLNLDRVGANDNFFELGGSSIQGVFVINQVQETLGEIIHVAVLFDASTVASLAAFLTKNYPQAVARVSGVSVASVGSDPTSERITAADIAAARRLIKPLPPRSTERGAQSPRNSPAIFILSPPRSGSTLLRVVLGGHPKLFAPPELELLSFNTLADRKTEFTGRHSFWLEGTIRAVMQAKQCSADDAKRIMAECEDQGLTTQKFYRRLQDWIGSRVLVDKTPSYALDLEILRRAEMDFENALYIHLLRHPYGMMRSFEEAKLEQIFFRYEHDLPRRKLAELVWLICHQNIREFLRDIPAARQCLVSFEELTGAPEPAVRRLCEFLRLDFTPEMLDTHKEKSSRMTDGIYKESKMLGDVKFHQHQGINAAMAEKWRDAYPEDFLGDLTWEMAASLGYERPLPAPAGGLDTLAKIDELSDAEVEAALRAELGE